MGELLIRSMRRKINWKVLVVCFLIVYSIAFVGSVFTSGNVKSEWYKSLRTSITPPNFVFPVVWNVLFFLIGLSLYFSWIYAKRIDKSKVILVFGINLFLNAFWSYLFFGIKNISFAFFDIILIWISIMGMMIVSFKINRKSAYLLIPYFLWVSFAVVLNWLILVGLK